MKSTKKLFAVLFAVMLVLSFAPMVVLAADTTAPVIYDDTLTVTPSVVSVGEQFTINIKVTDAESDISNVFAYVWLPNGTTTITQQELTRVDNSDFFEAEFTVPLTAQSGTYSIGISAQDISSNADNKSFSDMFAVTSTDITGPEIATPSVTPQLLEPGETFSISSVLTDLSTVNCAYVYLIDPNQTETRHYLNKNGESDEWKTDIVLPIDASSGVWSIRIEAFDGQNNRSECVVNDIFTVAVPFIPVTSITLDSSTLALNIGKTATLVATVSPTNATNKALVWTSSAPAIATVNANGKVTAVKAGIANITATTQDGSGKKATCTVTILPAAVSGAKAASAGYGSVKVSWIKVNDAGGYEVYRSTSSGGKYTKVGTVTSGSTVNFTNTSLTAGTTYYYKVRAYGMSGDTKVYTGYSSVVNVKPVPAKPAAKAVSASHNSIKANWDKISGASGYQVYRSTSSGGTYTKIGTITSGSTVSFTDKSLTTGKAYYYKVRAYRAVSGVKVYGSFSAVVYTKPVPAKPGSPKAANTGYNSIKVSWNKVTGATGYQVYRSTSSSGAYTKVGTVTGNSTVSFTNTGLIAGKSYHYKVRAYTKVGSSTVYGSYGTVVNAKPLPIKVSSPKAASTGYDRIKVSWTKVSGASGYEVYRATSSTGAYSLIKTVTSGSTVSFNNTGLPFNKTYYYKMRAYRTVGSSKVYGSFSSVVNAKTALIKVGTPKVAAPDYKSVKLNWSRVSGAGGYEIYRSTSSGGTYTKVGTVTSGSTVSFTNTGLTAGNTYYYKIRPYRIASDKIYGGFSAVISATPKYGTVYWVPNGSVFHVRKGCSTLSRSKTIYSGTVSESGKNNLCKVCG